MATILGKGKWKNKNGNFKRAGTKFFLMGNYLEILLILSFAIGFFIEILIFTDFFVVNSIFYQTILISFQVIYIFLNILLVISGLIVIAKGQKKVFLLILAGIILFNSNFVLSLIIESYSIEMNLIWYMLYFANYSMGIILILSALIFQIYYKKKQSDLKEKTPLIHKVSNFSIVVITSSVFILLSYSSILFFYPSQVSIPREFWNTSQLVINALLILSPLFAFLIFDYVAYHLKGRGYVWKNIFRGIRGY